MNDLTGVKNEEKIFLRICLVVFLTIVTMTLHIVALIKFNSAIESYGNNIMKPIIYLYPTEETELSVKLGYPKKITCSYPQYTGWNVLAKPNGDLLDLDTNKELYSLYYESESAYNFKVEKDGFVVKGEDTANFLEEKLAILGLTPRVLMTYKPLDKEIEVTEQNLKTPERTGFVAVEWGGTEIKV